MHLTSRRSVQITISFLTGWLFSYFLVFSDVFNIVFFSSTPVVFPKHTHTHTAMFSLTTGIGFHYKWIFTCSKLPNLWDKQLTLLGLNTSRDERNCNYLVKPSIWYLLFWAFHLYSSRMVGEKWHTKTSKPAKGRVKLQGRHFLHHSKCLPPPLCPIDLWANPSHLRPPTLFCRRY